MSDEKRSELSLEQVRVLSCLMEKHLATPNNYPLTPNSLTLAVNQKSNRQPVMNLDEGRVVSLAQQLKEKGYVSIDYGERINKFSHRAPGVLQISREEQAILAMLMLREPLTINELKARTEKMIGFRDLQQVQSGVESLMARATALVCELPVASGQREQRYTHLLAGEPDLSSLTVTTSKVTSGGQAAKIAELEERIQRLEKAMDMAWGNSSD